jgi:hypothetical protein
MRRSGRSLLLVFQIDHRLPKFAEADHRVVSVRGRACGGAAYAVEPR